MKSKDILIICIFIWFIASLFSSIVCYFMGKIPIDSYYIAMAGHGIWLTLINIYIDKE